MIDYHIPIHKNLIPQKTTWGIIANQNGRTGQNRPATKEDIIKTTESERHDFFDAMIERFGPQEGTDMAKLWGILDREIKVWNDKQIQAEDKNQTEEARTNWLEVQWLLAQQNEMFELKGQIDNQAILNAPENALKAAKETYKNKGLKILNQMEHIIENKPITHAQESIWKNPEYCNLYGQLRQIANYAYQTRRRLGEL